MRLAPTPNPLFEDDHDVQLEWERKFLAATGAVLRDGAIYHELLCDERTLVSPVSPILVFGEQVLEVVN